MASIPVLYANTEYVAGKHLFKTIPDGTNKSLNDLANALTCNVMTMVNDNVGIGTTNPTAALHVVGNVLATGTVTASNISVIGDFVTLNTITSNTEQMVIENAGTGPALKVTQTGANSIAEFYDDGGAIALKVADGGNVGIGTTAPISKLQIVSGSVPAALNQPSDTFAAIIYNANNGNLQGGLQVKNNWASDNTAIVDFGNDFAGGSNQSYYRLTGGGTHIFATSVSGSGNTRQEVMRITTDGSVGIGTTSVSAGWKSIIKGKVHIGDSIDPSTYGVLQITRTDAELADNRGLITLIRSGNAIWYIGYRTNNSTLYITPNYPNLATTGVSMTPSATSWASASDARLKRDIQPIEDVKAKVNELTGVYFNYKSESIDTPRRVGLIAQDVKKALPEIVTEDNEGIMSLPLQEVVPLLVNCIKDLYKENMELKQEIQQIKAHIGI